ncbi:MAG: RING-H2 finger protein [Candidatus Endonucleobacter bathymodioli]|uniref:RING-H2 finger protein n=1 Tax=Candidatus Endonucleibacter bathymodioli TaxID=539814 RepID=A0AA90NN91_9GAMM|nr:RING-H2 finger protein [Candidatus Endonucleobacter bathymodioli]
MSSILGNKKSVLLKKQWIRIFFLYGFFVLTSNLITGVSFGVYKFETYKTYRLRLASLATDLNTKFSHVAIEEFAKLGYFYAGYSTDVYAIIKCFSCGNMLRAESDIKCENLKSGHQWNCLYKNAGYVLVRVTSSENPKNSNFLPAKRKPSATISTPQPPITQNEQNYVSVVTGGDEQQLRAGHVPDRIPPVIRPHPQCRSGLEGLMHILREGDLVAGLAGSAMSSNVVKKDAVAKPQEGDRPDLSPIYKMLEGNSSSTSSEEVARESISTESTIESPIVTESSNIDSLGASVEGNILYNDIYQKMYITKKSVLPFNQKNWDCLYGKLAAMGPLELGVSFDMSRKDSNDVSFPVVVTKQSGSACCSFESAVKFKDIFFDGNSPWLCLSFLMEMDRKFLETIPEINSKQHIELKEAFANASLIYKPQGKKYLWGIDKTLSEIINEKGEVINYDDTNKSDVGALLYMAPRRVLLENKISAVDLADLVHGLCVMFCKKSILRRLRKSLCLSLNEAWVRRNRGVLASKTTVDENHESIPGRKEIAFIVTQHVCIFYMWEMWGMLKNGYPIPKYVDPRMALKSISMGYIKSCILEVTESLFNCTIKELQCKIDKNNVGANDFAITKEYIDNYIQHIVKQLASSVSLNLGEDHYFRTVFCGSEHLLSSSTTTYLYNAPTCIICLDELHDGVTEMIGFSSCIHVMEKICWDKYEENHSKCNQNLPIKCPMCRVEIRNIVDSIYHDKDKDMNSKKQK